MFNVGGAEVAPRSDSLVFNGLQIPCQATNEIAPLAGHMMGK